MTRLSRPVKSPGFVVSNGNPAAIAVAAIELVLSPRQDIEPASPLAASK